MAVAKSVFQILADSKGLQSIAAKYGMRHDRSFARRFVGGETVAEAIAAARRIEAAGMSQTLDYLGERVTSMADADAATRSVIRLIDEIAAAGIGRNLSLKLTQIGLTVDRATCVDNLRRVLDPAAAKEFFVRLEMEDSRYTQVTLDVFDTLWQQGYRNVGPVIQAYLPRSTDDARRLNQLGARVRLVKGQYNEPRRVAYRSKAQVDASFLAIARLLLTEGTLPAFATYDAGIISSVKALADGHGLSRDRYEFQLPFGIRRDVQADLTAAGYRVRVYIPFGAEWFPYVMRRIGERPSRLRFVVKSLLRDR
jgi:proline dehydrogenase